MSKKKLVILISIIICLTALVLVFSRSSLDKYDVSGIVQIAYCDVDPVCDIEENTMAASGILKTMQDHDALLLCQAIDTAIYLTSAELGSYSNLVVVNRAWLDRFGDAGKLKNVSMSDIPDSLQEFLNVQMPVWTINNAVLPEGIALCEYDDGLLSLPVNVGPSAPAFVSKNPLLIVIDAPADIMSASRFLIPLTSSGNLIFTDADMLQSEIENSCISPYVARLDDLLLE